MVKKYSWGMALTALVITIAIFAVGFIAANIYNDFKIAQIKSDYRSIANDIESLRLEEEYLETVAAERYCDLAGFRLESMGDVLDRTGKRLIAYQNSREFSSEFDQLKEDYALVQIRAWLLSIKAKEQCGLDIVTILYFHDIACDSCEQQGYTLDYFKQLLGGKILTFSMDRYIDLPVIQLIQQDFGIETTPALIVNRVHHNQLSKEDLQSLLCSEYTEKPDFC